MRTILISFTIAALLGLPIYSQIENKETPEKNEAVKKKETGKTESKYTIFSELMLEDFETNQYNLEKNLDFKVTRYQKADCSIKEENPAPTGKSKKYLGIKFLGKSWGNASDVLIIKPAKEIVIEKYCREISVWVYGRKMAGELSIYLQDAKETNHRLVFGRLNFLGWQKLTVKLDKRISQSDEFLNQKRVLKILQIQYRPSNITQVPMWHYFYLDELSATVREKYSDRQSDDW